MKARWVWIALVAIGGLAAYAGKVLATPQHGFSGTTHATAKFGALQSHVHTVPADWQFLLQSKGVSDLYVQDNTWAAGGSTGWHTHPGPSLIIVTEGTLTVYEGDDPCTPHVYSTDPTKGPSSFVDVGGGVVHLIRNETGAEAKAVAVQFVPGGATRRIDADAPPGACVD